jgi:RNA polymerase-binding transcription factor
VSINTWSPNPYIIVQLSKIFIKPGLSDLYSKEESAHFRQLLLHRQQQLRDLIAGSADTTKPVELDQSSVGRLSRMDAMQGQAMSLERERRNRRELTRIAAALRRIDNEEFGYCESCGEDIARQRLEIDPAAILCIDCARRSEQPSNKP